MSRIQVPMPQMGESIAEGTVSVWLKKVGDAVDRDEPLMEISTDKVDAEIPSPAAGVLAEILVAEGETVGVGTVVAYLETEAATSGPQLQPSDGAPATAGSQPESTPGPERASGAAAPLPRAEGRSDQPAAPSRTPRFESGHPVHSSSEPAPPAHAQGRSPAPPASPDAGAESEEERLKRRSTPLVRRIAEEHGVPLDQVTGSGRGGRVTKEDILRHVEGRAEASPAARPTPPRAAPAAGDDFSMAGFHTRVEHPRVAIGPRDRVEPMDRMTSLIAEHMVLSRRISAHVHSFIEVDYTRVDLLRESNRQEWEEAPVKVTYTAFVALAVVRALREFPRLNASISGSDIVYRGEINLGIAVALDWGLIVPVIGNAGDLSIVGLARSITDLATRARGKKLSPEEVNGGTFTITNPGIFGTALGLPILNQPQVGILGIGAVEKRPAVVSDEFGNDAVVPRKRGYLSLGFDHRLVNGADADRFLGRVRSILETMQECG